MREMRDAQGRVLTPAQQAEYLDVPVAIGHAPASHGL
jgi:hypothetical protein